MSEKTELVKMINGAGHTADVHPEMVDHYREGGYREMTEEDGEGSGGSSDTPLTIKDFTKDKLIEELKIREVAIPSNTNKETLWGLYQAELQKEAEGPKE